MLAPRNEARGDGSSPVKTQAEAVPTNSSVEETGWLPEAPPVTNNVWNVIKRMINNVNATYLASRIIIEVAAAMFPSAGL